MVKVRKYTIMVHCFQPVDYVEKDWNGDAYSGGCYSSVFPPGVVTQFAK